jgi:acetolactate synthase-1/2/3 large subunit
MNQDLEYTGGQAVADTLAHLGSDVVFGLPGQHALSIWDALAEVDLLAVHSRTELAATFAADGYARTSGRPAAVVLSTGPGALNSLTGLMEAALSHAPVVAIATQIEQRFMGAGRGVLHELRDQRGSFAPIVKSVATATSPESIGPLIHAAWGIAAAPPQGPVFLEIPTDFLDARVEKVPLPSPSVIESAWDGGEALEKAANWLSVASRPVIWAGSGVLRAGAWSELRALAEKLEVPVATTYMGKGAIDERHPLALGSACAEDPVRSSLEAADVVLCIGTELGAEATNQHSLKLPERLIHVDAAPERIGATYPALPLVGDARMILGELIDACAARTGHPTEQDRPNREPQDGLEAGLLAAVRRALPEDAIHCWDSTLLGYWAAAHFPTYGPRTFSYPVGSGTIGYSWPAAIGVKLAAEDAPVLAISGDGGILYGLVELGTAAQFDIAAKLLIVDDRSYGVLRHFQEQRFGRPSAVDRPATDFVAIAGGFGVPAKEVTSDKLESGLDWALDQPGPAVVVTQAELGPPPGI